MARVLIPDYPSQAAVAALRSLSRSGDTCHVAAPMKRLDRRLHSRAIQSWHDTNLITDDPDNAAANLIAMCQRQHIDVLLSTSPNSTAFFGEHGELIRSVAPFLAPTPDVFRVANDKLATQQLCERVGIPTPRTYELASEADVDAAARSLSFPAVVKPRVGRGATGLNFVNSPDEVRQAWGLLTAEGRRSSISGFSRPIAQEFIPGPVHDACAVAYRGEIVNVLTQTRALMRPVVGGIGAINISTDEPELKRHAATVVEALGFDGPLQIEFKRDRRDGQFKLLEVNPRVWGTLDFSIKLGMDFPGQIRDLALGRPVPRGLTYPVGARYRFVFPQALDAYLQLVKVHGWRSLRGIARGCRPSFRDFDFRDPVPDVVRAIRVLRLLARHGPGDGLRNLPADLVPVYRG